MSMLFVTTFLECHECFQWCATIGRKTVLNIFRFIMDAEEDFSKKIFKVIASDPNGEYILSDPVTPGTSPTSRSHTEKELRPVKNIFDSDWGDISIEDELARFTDPVENARPVAMTLKPNTIQGLKTESDSKDWNVEDIVSTLVQPIQNGITDVIPDLKSEQGDEIPHGVLHVQSDCDNIKCELDWRTYQTMSPLSARHTPYHLTGSNLLEDCKNQTTKSTVELTNNINNTSSGTREIIQQPGRGYALASDNHVYAKEINGSQNENNLSINRVSTPMHQGICQNNYMDPKSTPSNIIKPHSPGPTSKKRVHQSNTAWCSRDNFMLNNVDSSEVKQVPSSNKHVDSGSSNCASKTMKSSLKRKGLVRGLHVLQTSRKSKHVNHIHSNSTVARCDNKVSLTYLPSDMFQKVTGEIIQNLIVQEDRNNNPKEITKSYNICLANANCTLTSSISTETTSQCAHNSSCECINCKNKRKPSGTNPQEEPIQVQGSQRLFVCQKCNKNYSRYDNLRRHILEVHSEEKKFVCHECCKAYKNKVGLDYHMLRCHNPYSHQFKCKKCHKFFLSNNDLKRHLQRSHLEAKINKPKACEVCQKVFSSRSSMLQHKNIQHNTYDKQFICNDCSTVFSDKNALKIHIRTLHMPPEFKCSLCSESFPTNIKLKDHLRKVHGKENRKTLVCETCGKIIMNGRFGLENHMITHTDTKPHICEECGKSFRTITNLKQHTVIHSDIRRYSCNICVQSFRIRHHLRQHMAVHGLASTPDYSKKARMKKTANDSVQESCSVESSE